MGVKRAFLYISIQIQLQYIRQMYIHTLLAS